MDPCLEEINDRFYEREDYFGDEGCCLTCNEQDLFDFENGKCLCYDCKCRKCYWYRVIGYSKEREDYFGHCVYPRQEMGV